MTKGVYFDLDGIYFNRGISTFLTNFSEIHSVPKHTLEAGIRRSKEGHDYKLGKIVAEDFFAHVNKVIGKNISTNEYLSEMAESFEVNPEAKALTIHLREMGIKTLACANMYEDLVDLLNLEYKFLADFDHAVFSFQVGALKPHKEIYQALLQTSGLAAEEILYVEDDRRACETARELGFKVVCEESINPILAEFNLPLVA